MIIKKFEKRNDSIYVELEDIPFELKNPALWSYLQGLKVKGINAISFQVLTEDRSNTPTYNFVRFMYANYLNIHEIYKLMKKVLGSNVRDLELRVPEGIEERIAESFTNQLKQLTSNGILFGVEYANRVIKLEQVFEPSFITGKWFEIAVADQVVKICPFSNAVVLKNFIFSVGGSKSEVDLLLIHEDRSFLFEIKTGIKLQSLEEIQYKLLRKAYLLNAENVSLIIPSLRDAALPENQVDAISDEDVSQILSEKLKGITVLTIQNLDVKLREIFLREMLKRYEH